MAVLTTPSLWQQPGCLVVAPPWGRRHYGPLDLWPVSSQATFQSPGVLVISRPSTWGLEFGQSVGWPTNPVCPVLTGFLGQGTFSANTGTVPSKQGQLVPLPGESLRLLLSDDICGLESPRPPDLPGIYLPPSHLWSRQAQSPQPTWSGPLSSSLGDTEAPGLATRMTTQILCARTSSHSSTARVRLFRAQTTAQSSNPFSECCRPLSPSPALGLSQPRPPISWKVADRLGHWWPITEHSVSQEMICLLCSSYRPGWPSSGKGVFGVRRSVQDFQSYGVQL